jgi:hypothetical protein
MNCTIYALVYRQLSDSSIGEVQADEDSDENNDEHNLINLIKRIRATHIAVQSGNARQDEPLSPSVCLRVNSSLYIM